MTIKKIIFTSIIILSSLYLQQTCFANTNSKLDSTPQYSPQWTYDEDFWQYTSNKSMSCEGVVDAAYSPTLKQWVCLLKTGEILVSNDLQKWKRYSMGTEYEMTSIIWANNLYVACGETLLYSKDGITWLKANIKLNNSDNATRERGVEYDILDNIYWNGKQFLIYGIKSIFPIIFVSENGIDWMMPEFDSEYTIGFDFCWNGSSWLAVGNDNSVLCSSADGKWFEENKGKFKLSGSAEELSVNEAVWTGSKYYAIDEYGALYSSNDGLRWEGKKENIYNTDNYFTELLWDGKRLYICGIDEDCNSIAYSCIPGEKWTKINLPFNVTKIIQYNNKLYAFSNSPDSSTTFVSVSNDGAKWKNMKTNMSFDGVKKVKYANGYFYIQTVNSYEPLITKDGKNYKKTDGIEQIEDIASKNKTWVAIAPGGQIYQSKNGVDFDLLQTDKVNNNKLSAITTYSDGWCVVGEKGTILISKNGKTFTKVNSPTNKNLLCIYWDGAVLAAGGEDGVILVSKDKGKTWSISYKKLEGMSVKQIVKGNGHYIAILSGDNYYDYNNERILRTVLVSKDGLNWNMSGIPWSSNYITFYNGYFIALENCNYLGFFMSEAKYWCSSDGEHWVPHYLTDTNQIIEGAAVGNDLMMMWTGNGELYTTNGAGEIKQSNRTVTGNINLPVGMDCNEDGIEVTLAMTYKNATSNDVGLFHLKIKPGENKVKYSLPIKIPVIDNIISYGFSIDVYVKNSMGLITSFNVPIKYEKMLAGENCDINILPEYYTFKDADLEKMVREQIGIATGKIPTNDILNITTLVLNKFSENMVSDIQNMTSLINIIVREDLQQEVIKYFPDVETDTYISDEQYDFFANGVLEMK